MTTSILLRNYFYLVYFILFAPLKAIPKFCSAGGDERCGYGGWILGERAEEGER